MSEEQVIEQEEPAVEPELAEEPQAEQAPQPVAPSAPVAVEEPPFQPLEEIPGDPDAASVDIDQVLDLRIGITVELASTQRSIAEILNFRPGAVLELERDVHEPVDILVNGTCLAKGEVVTVGERYGVRITEILDPEARVLLAGNAKK